MLIRKVSIGPDYLKSMNYSVGQPAIGNATTIHQISRNAETGFIEIHIINKYNEVTLWKSFSPTIPMCIESNIDHFLERRDA